MGDNETPKNGTTVQMAGQKSGNPLVNRVTREKRIFKKELPEVKPEGIIKPAEGVEVSASGAAQQKEFAAMETTLRKIINDHLGFYARAEELSSLLKVLSAIGSPASIGQASMVLAKMPSADPLDYQNYAALFMKDPELAAKGLEEYVKTFGGNYQVANVLLKGEYIGPAVRLIGGLAETRDPHALPAMLYLYGVFQHNSHTPSELEQLQIALVRGLSEMKIPEAWEAMSKIAPVSKAVSDEIIGSIFAAVLPTRISF